MPDIEAAVLAARVELKMSTADVSPRWVGEQVALAGIVDQLAESADRLSGRHVLALECQERGITQSTLAERVEQVAQQIAS